MPGPTGLEERVIFHTNALLRDLAEGLEDASGARLGAPWRLESERKVVGIGESQNGRGLTPEIESYSDRYRRPGATPAGGNARLDPDVLHLSRDLLPPALWTEYFEGNTGAEKKARAIARANRRKRVLDEDDDEGDGEPSDNEEDEEDFDFDDEDEEDHQDYDHNYFDNGEGDDDSGGEGGDGE
jgi:DNA-directed RNA polymerase III subunit RPC7